MEIIKKLKWILVIIGVIIFFLVAHNSLFYYLGTWIFILFPISIAFFLFLLLTKIKKISDIRHLKIRELNTAKVFGVPMICALLFFLSFGFFAIQSSENKIEKYGVVTNATIVEVELSYRYSVKGLKYNQYIATVEFEVEGQICKCSTPLTEREYYILITNGKNGLIKVKYLPKNPIDCKIIIDEIELQ